MAMTKRLSKKERRNKRIRTGICIASIAVLLLVAGVLFLRKQVRENFASGGSDVQSAEVTVGSIRATVSGSGSLESDGVTEVTVPAGVGIRKIYAEEGAAVTEGDVLASVDASSVLSALSDTQKELDELDGKLVEILSGLEAGSTVYYRYAESLSYDFFSLRK